MAGDGRAPCESGGAGEKFRTWPIQTDEGGNSAATGRISELEQMLKQVTVTMSSLSFSRILHSYLHPAVSMESLPDELLINLFIRLKAKQLAQMRSVSKSWNVLLSHPSFVKSHLNHSIHNNNQQILLVFYDCNRPFKQYSSQSLHLEPTNFIKNIPIDLPRRVIGSVNGLICLSEGAYIDFHIWNPSLSAVSPIPLPHSLSYDFPNIHYLRFGFDPKTEDYKLVKISEVLDSKYNLKKWLPVEVYSMRKGTWEFINQPFPSHITRISNFDYLCVDGHDGHLHWQIETVVKTEERKILAFDLGSETFREIPLPDSTLDPNHGLHCLGVLGGKLCEMTRRNDGSWKVWVMEEYGVPESWVKRHVFSQFNDPFNDCLFLYGFTSRSELLLIDEYYQLTLYDPIANKTKFAHTELIAIRVVEYVDSLVWV